MQSRRKGSHVSSGQFDNAKTQLPYQNFATYSPAESLTFH